MFQKFCKSILSDNKDIVLKKRIRFLFLFFYLPTRNSENEDIETVSENI